MLFSKKFEAKQSYFETPITHWKKRICCHLEDCWESFLSKKRKSSKKEFAFCIKLFIWMVMIVAETGGWHGYGSDGSGGGGSGGSG